MRAPQQQSFGWSPAGDPHNAKAHGLSGRLLLGTSKKGSHPGAACGGLWREGLTGELLLEDGGEGGEQVLQQLRQAALEQPWGTAVRLRLHHHLPGVL